MEPDTRTADEPVDVHLRDYLWVLRKHLGVAVTFFVAVVVLFPKARRCSYLTL